MTAPLRLPDRSYRELLEALMAEVQALRAALRAAQPGTARRPEEDLAPLALAIAEAVGCHDFNAGELLDLAAHKEQLREALGSRNARQIGKLLSRMEGHDFDSVRLVRLTTDRDGAVWSVQKEGKCE
jgi:hypothetical protein